MSDIFPVPIGAEGSAIFDPEVSSNFATDAAFCFS
jgi:hypothetical protein